MDTDRAQRASGNDPGWKWIAEQGVYLWWDGQRYTHSADWDGTSWSCKAYPPPAPTLPATPFARNTIIGLALTGCAVLVWGYLRYADQGPKQCEGNALQTYYGVGPLWLPWLVLLVLAISGYLVRQRRARRVRWISTMAHMGVVVTLLTFPVVAFLLEGMNCGL
jgi:hypothetical protein